MAWDYSHRLIYMGLSAGLLQTKYFGERTDKCFVFPNIGGVAVNRALPTNPDPNV